MGLGAKSSKQSSSQSSRSESSTRGEVIAGSRLQSAEQRAAEQKLLPVATQQALADGLTAKERTAATVATEEDINRRTAGTIGNLATRFGQSGIRGGANKQDVLSALETGISASGRAAGELSRKGIDVADRRKAGVLQSGLSPTGRIAQRSSSRSAGRGSSSGKSFGFSIGSS